MSKIAVSGNASGTGVFTITSPATNTDRTITLPDGDGAMPLIKLETAKTATGTAVDFTAIPSWVKRITVMFSGISTNGSSAPRIQIGTSGGIQTSGYLGSGGVLATGVAASTDTGGFLMSSVGNWSASTTVNGTVALSLMDSSTGLWSCSGLLGTSGSGTLYFTGGSKALSGILDRIRITTANGTDTFDAGTINIMYEG